MTDQTPRTIRTSIISAIAVVTLAAPLLVSAAVDNSNPNTNLLKAQKAAAKINDPQSTYARLQDQSRDICGPSSVRMAGDLRRAFENDRCYEGTLNAAVSRLDNPRVTELHQES